MHDGAHLASADIIAVREGAAVWDGFARRLAFRKRDAMFGAVRWCVCVETRLFPTFVLPLFRI